MDVIKQSLREYAIQPVLLTGELLTDKHRAQLFELYHASHHEADVHLKKQGVPPKLYSKEEWLRIWDENPYTTYHNIIMLLNPTTADVIGVAIWSYNEDLQQCVVYNVYLLPERRGTGLGKLLMTLLLDDIKDRCPGIPITLSVNVTNQVALNLYKTLGFTQTLDVTLVHTPL